MAGTNPKVVSEVLGHKEVAITLDRYSHALPTMQTDAMARLDAVLGSSPLDRPEEAPAAAAGGRRCGPRRTRLPTGRRTRIAIGTR